METKHYDKLHYHAYSTYNAVFGTHVTPPKQILWVLSLSSLDCIWHSFSFPPFEVYLHLASETVITILVITPASKCGLTEAQSLDRPLPFFGYTHPLDDLILFCVNTIYILKMPTFTSPTHTPPELQTHISNCRLYTSPWISNERDLIKSSSQFPSFFATKFVPPIIFAISPNGNSILLVA